MDLTISARFLAAVVTGGYASPNSLAETSKSKTFKRFLNRLRISLRSLAYLDLHSLFYSGAQHEKYHDKI